MRSLLTLTAAIALLSGAALAADQTTTQQQQGQSPSSSRSLNSGSSGMSKNDVEQSLKQQGYTNVTGLRQDQGMWQGDGKKNGQDTHFRIDNTGNIMNQPAK